MAASMQRHAKKAALTNPGTVIYLRRTDRHIATLQTRHGFAARSTALLPGLKSKKQVS